jgi:large subunit ribosomal protein L29
MKYIDIANQDKKSLQELLKEKKMLLFTLRNKLKLMQITNTNEIREVKRDIARINMAISQQEESADA